MPANVKAFRRYYAVNWKGKQYSRGHAALLVGSALQLTAMDE